MKTDPGIQRRLLELAEIDGELARINHKRKNLPELAEIEAAEKTLRASEDALVAVRTAATDLDREVSRQEKEIDSVRAREERDRKLMQSGSVTAKVHADLQHELETLERRQNALEDDLLELMERREALDIDVQRSGADVDVCREKLADAQQRMDSALTDLVAIEERRKEERNRLFPLFPAELIEVYEQVRLARGRGAGLLRARRCGACQLELDRATIAGIKSAAPDAVVFCDNCGAILVRTAESGL